MRNSHKFTLKNALIWDLAAIFEHDAANSEHNAVILSVAKDLITISLLEGKADFKGILSYPQRLFLDPPLHSGF